MECLGKVIREGSFFNCFCGVDRECPEFFHTNFKNCNGLDEEGHVTSAYDVALMSRELIKYEKIKDYTLTWMDSVRDHSSFSSTWPA